MNGSVSVLIIDGGGNSLWLHGVQAELILKARTVDEVQARLASISSGSSRRYHGRRAPSSRREPILHYFHAPYGWPAPATSRHERRMPLVNSTRHVATRPPCPRRCPRSSRPGWAAAHRMGRAR